jgi:hypothetical protein
MFFPPFIEPNMNVCFLASEISPNREIKNKKTKKCSDYEEFQWVGVRKE